MLSESQSVEPANGKWGVLVVCAPYCPSTTIGYTEYPLIEAANKGRAQGNLVRAYFTPFSSSCPV